MLLVVAVTAALEILAGPIGGDLNSIRIAALVAFVLVVLIFEAYRRWARR